MTADLVIVRWEDTTNVAAWLTPDEVREHATNGGWICENVGWLVHEDSECVVVASRRSLDAQLHAGLVERIPRRSVLSIYAADAVDRCGETFVTATGSIHCDKPAGHEGCIHAQRDPSGPSEAFFSDPDRAYIMSGLSS